MSNTLSNIVCYVIELNNTFEVTLGESIVNMYLLSWNGLISIVYCFNFVTYVEWVDFTNYVHSDLFPLVIDLSGKLIKLQ